MLTDAGWPRPRVEGWPIPWVAPTHNLSEVNEGRRLAAVGGGICQVCGEGFAYGEEALAFTTTPKRLGKAFTRANLPLEHGEYLSELFAPATVIMVFDGAVMHRRCAKLTATMCPHIRDRDDLICLRVPANDADPQQHENGTYFPTYPAGNCEYVPWPTD